MSNILAVRLVDEGRLVWVVLDLHIFVRDETPLDVGHPFESVDAFPPRVALVCPSLVTLHDVVALARCQRVRSETVMNCSS